MKIYKVSYLRLDEDTDEMETPDDPSVRYFTTRKPAMEWAEKVGGGVSVMKISATKEDIVCWMNNDGGMIQYLINETVITEIPKKI